jgi:HAD superfamily phosphatase (TIGR01668 family)
VRDVPEDVAAWVRRLDEAGVRLCIVPNTHRPRRLSELAAVLGVQCFPSGGKPRRRGFFRAIAAMGVKPEETMVVGDQLLTDIWGGNRCGLPTILVEPLSGIEFIGTKLVSRNVERLILRMLESRGAAMEQIPPLQEEDGPASAGDR